MTKAKTARLPLGAQIGLILLAGVIVSLVVWIACRNHTSVQADTVAGERYTVTFAYSDGTVIQTATVEEGKGVYPPKPVSEEVFRGWNGAVNNVTNHTEVHPLFYTINENNLFYFDAVYAEEGTQFTVDVYVAGRVSLSAGVLSVSYDPEVLEYVSCAEGAGVTVSESQSGELELSLSFDEAAKEKTLLTQLTFYAKPKDAYATRVDLKADEMKVVVDGQTMPADCATINNKIFFLQEVTE